MLYRPDSKWTWAYFLSAFLEAVVAISIATAIFVMVGTNMKDNDSPSSRVFYVFLVLLMLGFLYRLVLVYDTLAQQNTVEAFGICVYSVILCISISLQYQQVQEAVAVLAIMQFLSTPWSTIQSLLISVTVTTGCFTLWSFFLIWKLRKDFAWEVFRKVDADLEMQRRYRLYQIFVALLKFDAFFILGYIVQFYIFTSMSKVDFAVVSSLVAIPSTCILLPTSAYFVRHEHRAGTITIIVLQCSLLAYAIWTLWLIYSPQMSPLFLVDRPSLALFGSMFILLLCGTITLTCMCFRNFGKGLKPYVASGNKASLLEEAFEMESRQTYLRIPHYREP